MREEGRKGGNASPALEQTIFDAVTRWRPGTVADLVKILREKRGVAVSEEEIVRLVEELEGDGRLRLHKVPPSFASFSEYLRNLEWSLDFWIVCLLSALTLIAVSLVPDVFPLVALRWAVGIAFLVFAPGHALIEVLFPRSGELDLLERLVLSVGASLVLLPLIGLILNYTPFGLRLTPMLVALLSVTLPTALLSAVRKYSVLTQR